MTWVPFEQDEVLPLFTTESRQKNREMFLRTHHPIRRVLVTHNRIGLENGTFLAEEEVLGLLELSRPLESNRIFFVVGETGCGKSEFCQWLEYHLSKSHVPVHVSRSQSSVQGMLGVLYRHLPPSVVRKTDLPQDLLLEHLRLSFRIQAHRSGNDLWVESVGFLLEKHFPDLVTWFQRGALQAEWQDDWTVKLPMETLIHWLEMGFREALGVQSLGEVLREVAFHYASLGKRPVLLLEDVTTLAFLRDDLMDYLFDLSAAGFDAVIGLTSGFEQAHVVQGSDLTEMAYVRERLAARLVLSSNQGETFFLMGKSHLLELVRGYMSCLPQRSTGEVFGGVYPFTPLFVERLYGHLIEGGNVKQTPRNLLDAVVKNALLHQSPPHVTLMQDHPSLKRPSVRFRQDGLSKEAVGLLYWYGEEVEGKVMVAEEVARHFGFDVLPSVDAYHLPVPPVSPIPLHQLQQQDTRESEWEETFRQMRGWLEHGEVFPKRHHVKLGLSRFITAVFDARLVQHPDLTSSFADPLYYFRTPDNLPIHLEGSGDTLPPEDWPVMVLSRSVPSRVYEEFLSYAFSASGAIECFSDPGFTFEFTRDLVKDFQQRMRLQLRKLLGMEVETFVLGAWCLVQHLSFGLTSQQMQDREMLLRYDFPQYLQVSVWNDPLLQVLTRTNGEILADRGVYQRLFMSFFHCRDDLIDREKLDHALEHFRVEGWFRQVSLIDLKLLRKAAYRQQFSKKPLWELVRPLVEYSRAIAEYNRLDRDRERLRRNVLALEGHLKLGDQAPDLIAQIRQWVEMCGWSSVELPAAPTMDRVTWQEMQHNAALAIRYVERSAAVHKGFLRFWNEKVSQVSALRWNEEVNVQVDRLHALLQSQFQQDEGWDVRQQEVSLRFDQVMARLGGLK